MRLLFGGSGGFRLQLLDQIALLSSFSSDCFSSASLAGSTYPGYEEEEFRGEVKEVRS